MRAAFAVLALLAAEVSRDGGRAARRPELPPPAARRVDFVRDVKPILDRACLRCHATPEVVVTMNRARNRGGLSLSTRTEALKGGSNIGVVIVPGKSAESPLVHLVAGYPHEKTQVRAMPPGEKERLSRAEVGVLRAWIDQGAAWPE